MGYSPELDMYRGRYPSVPPKGYNSEPRRCPVCGKKVMGREEGMTSHIMRVHRASRDVARDAIRRAKITWSTEDEIRQRNAAAPEGDAS